LRAVAVLAVLINHLNEHLLPGGYLGVDIFFVISGFVVTASLARRKDANWREFLQRFYQRRFKRLLPALIINVFVVSILFAAFASPLDDVRVPSLRTGITSLIGVSNLYLLKQGTDYFALNTQFNPFTHTWSLGVEEQYYLLWPILLLICGAGIVGTKHTARKLGLMSIILLAGSLAYYLFLNSTGQQAASFFLMPARFWELSAGSLAFLIHSKSATTARHRSDQEQTRAMITSAGRWTAGHHFNCFVAICFLHSP
jgi:peptidoglycan/LPS O-acetylase OafA/YrhL